MKMFYLKIFTLLLVILDVLTTLTMSEQNSLRVATFNIRYDGHDSPPALSFVENENFISLSVFDGEQPWYIRRKKVADTILFHRVDIIGLQEVLHNQVKDLEVLLGEDWEWTGAGRDDGKNGGEFVPIFYNKKRIELLESKNFWLSKTPEVPSKGWDAGLPRMVTQASFRDTLTNSTFWFLNTHFDDRGRVARKESAKLILKRYQDLLKSCSDPVILTGDLNCIEGDEPYRVLTGEKYENSKLSQEELSNLFGDTRYEISRPGATSFGNSNTFTGFSSGVEPVRIDFIFVSNEALTSPRAVEILNHGVMSNLYDDEMYISDHRPVIADLVLTTL